MQKLYPKKPNRSNELRASFHPIGKQFTLIKTDENANIRWGVRIYRD